MKIAFIVQPDWLREHFGVRNLFVSCFKILEQKGTDVDFVHFHQYYDRVRFYKNIVSDADLKSAIRFTAIGTRKAYETLTKRQTVIPTGYFQYLGEDIADDYDAFIITNPWLMTYPLDFKNKPAAVICYDCGANSLNLLNVINDYSWGFPHNMGYQKSLKNNYHFLPISKTTDNEIADYYQPLKHSFLQPVPTYAFFDADYKITQIKEKAIILAATFDPKKGLAKMPEVLNGIYLKVFNLSLDFSDTIYFTLEKLSWVMRTCLTL